jgi:Leucine-rich repeat (LRR) protein
LHPITGDLILVVSAQLDLYNATLSLRLTNNPISSLPDGFLARTMPQLKYLFAPNTNLRELNDKALQNLSRLVYLELTDNALETIHDDAFATNPLQQLLLSNCNLAVIPKAVKTESTLIALGVPRNKLTSLAGSDFMDLTQLMVLNIQTNPIHTISESTFVNNRALSDLMMHSLDSPVLPLTLFDTLTRLEALRFNALALTGSSRLESRHFKMVANLMVLELNFQRLSAPFVRSWDLSFARR